MLPAVKPTHIMFTTPSLGLLPTSALLLLSVFTHSVIPHFSSLCLPLSPSLSLLYVHVSLFSLCSMSVSARTTFLAVSLAVAIILMYVILFLPRWLAAYGINTNPAALGPTEMMSGRTGSQVTQQGTTSLIVTLLSHWSFGQSVYITSHSYYYMSVLVFLSLSMSTWSSGCYTVSL